MLQTLSNLKDPFRYLRHWVPLRFRYFIAREANDFLINSYERNSSRHVALFPISYLRASRSGN